MTDAIWACAGLIWRNDFSGQNKSSMEGSLAFSFAEKVAKQPDEVLFSAQSATKVAADCTLERDSQQACPTVNMKATTGLQPQG